MTPKKTYFIISYLVDSRSAKPHNLIKKQESGEKCILGLKYKTKMKKLGWEEKPCYR